MKQDKEADTKESKDSHAADEQTDEQRQQHMLALYTPMMLAPNLNPDGHCDLRDPVAVAAMLDNF